MLAAFSLVAILCAAAYYFLQKALPDIFGHPLLTMAAAVPIAIVLWAAVASLLNIIIPTGEAMNSAAFIIVALSAASTLFFKDTLRSGQEIPKMWLAWAVALVLFVAMSFFVWQHAAANFWHVLPFSHKRALPPVKFSQ